MHHTLRRSLWRALLAAAIVGVFAGGSSEAHAHGTGQPTPADGELLLGTPREILVEISGTAPVELVLRRVQGGKSIAFTGTVERTDGLVRAVPPVLEHGTYVLEWESSGGSGWSTFSVGKTDTVVSSKALPGRPFAAATLALLLLATGVLLAGRRGAAGFAAAVPVTGIGAAVATPPAGVLTAATFLLLWAGALGAAGVVSVLAGQFRDQKRALAASLTATPFLLGLPGAVLLRSVPVNPSAPAAFAGYAVAAVVVAIVLPFVALSISGRVRAGRGSGEMPALDGADEAKPPRRVLPLLAFAAVFGGAAAVLPVDARLDTITEETLPAVACLTGSNRLEIQRCLDASLVATARGEGVTAALDTLRDLLPVDGRARYFCHEASHAIGRESLATNGNLADAFRDGYDVCDFGYYHGIVEGAAAGFDDATFLDRVPSLCEDFASAEELFYMQCNHGIGHAAARRTNNDMLRALEFCDALEQNPNLTGERLTIARNGCGTGVTMEWFATATADPNAAVTPRVSRPRDVCVVVPEQWATECVEYVGNTLDASDPVNSLLELGAWCETTGHETACYRGLARAAAGVGIPARDAIVVCENAGDRASRDECVTFYIAAVATTIDYDVAAVDRICRELPEADRSGRDSLCERVRTAVVAVLAAGDGKNRG